MNSPNLRFFEGCGGIKKNLGILNGNLVKEWGDFLFCGFLEFWVGKYSKVYPGWEIFFNEEKPTVVIKEVQEKVDWMDYMDAEAMETMLKMEGDVFAIINEEPSDPFAFIMLAMGQLNNWTWVGFF